MKNTLTLLLCFAIYGISSVTAVFAEAPQTPSQTAPDFYQWLDKYQNPTVQTHARKPIQSVNAVAKEENGAAGQPSNNTPADNLSVPLETPAFVDTSYEVVEPGEGLGCFYHRSYYSHLPLFKDSAYHLAGSLAVAEPAQVPPSIPAVSPADSVR